MAPHAPVAAGRGRCARRSQPWDIQVVDQRFFRAVLAQGSLGLGEAYQQGWWTCNDLEELSYRLINSGLYKLSFLVPLTMTASLLDAIVNQQYGASVLAKGPSITSVSYPTSSKIQVNITPESGDTIVQTTDSRGPWGFRF